MLVDSVLEFNRITALPRENVRNQHSYKGNKEGIGARKKKNETKKERKKERKKNGGPRGAPLSTAENNLPKVRNKHKRWSNRSPYFSIHSPPGIYL